jgi:hypothetical protein
MVGNKETNALARLNADIHGILLEPQICPTLEMRNFNSKRKNLSF